MAVQQITALSNRGLAIVFHAHDLKFFPLSIPERIWAVMDLEFHGN